MTLETRSYLANNTGYHLAEWSKHLPQLTATDPLAARSVARIDLMRRHLRECFAVDWHHCRVLDLGCGQLLRQALIVGVNNTVVGIDLELPFAAPWAPDFIRAARLLGWKRALKTLARQASGMDRRFRRSLRHQLHIDRLPKITLHRMSATALEFPDACFDGAYSFSTFQHIDHPETAVAQLARVLRPGGVAYIDLHLYTSPGGSDHPLLSTASDQYPPWGHLRRSTPFFGRHGLYLNTWRLDRWRKLLEQHFSEVRYPLIPGEQEKSHPRLTPEIRHELADYSEEELLTTTFIAVCRRAP